MTISRALSAVLFATSLASGACADLEPETAIARGAVVRSAAPLPGKYIVKLRAPAGAPVGLARAAEVHASIDRLAAAHAVTVDTRFTAAVDGFAATMTEAEAEALAADPEVELVEEDGVIHGDETVQANATWGIDRIDQAALPLDSKYTALGTGEGVTAYIVDSGMRATHIEFTGRLLPGFTAIADGQGTNDCNQHGTHVAGTVGGTILGVAKKVSFVPVRVLDCASNGSISGIISGLDWIVANLRPRAVANISIGGPASAIEDAAVRRVINAGVTVVTSAGNDGVDACNQSPGRTPEAITIAATDKLDARASFSNFGTCVDLHAPGVGIVSASVAGDTLSRTLSGTSQATPHVSGAVALYLESHPNATPAEVVQAVKAGATPGLVTDLRGSPNLMLRTAFADAGAPMASITSPADGARVGDSFTVTATATDPHLTTVALVVDGTVVETRETGPFTFEVRGLAAGSHSVKITAADAAEHTTTAAIQVTVAGAPGEMPMGEEPMGEEPAGVAGGCAAGGGGGGASLAAALLGLVAVRRRRRRG